MIGVGFSYVSHSALQFLVSFQGKFDSLDIWQVGLTFQYFLNW